MFKVSMLPLNCLKMEIFGLKFGSFRQKFWDKKFFSDSFLTAQNLAVAGSRVRAGKVEPGGAAAHLLITC